MLIGLMTNYPSFSIFLIWCLLFALAYIEQTAWPKSGPIHKLAVLLLWSGVFFFLYYVIKLMDVAAEYLLVATIGCGILILSMLVIHFRKPRELHPGAKMVCNVLIVVIFFLVFLL